MNGPEHYIEAERLLDFADSAAGRGAGEADQAIAAAQVHATLALAAAVADKRDHTPQQDWGGTSTLLASHHEWDEATR